MTGDSTVRIALLLPDLLGTYGDRGNAIVLAHRLLMRGYNAEILDVPADRAVPRDCDIYLLGGGEDAAGIEAVRVLKASAFPAVVDRGATVFAVCAGMQILGTLSTTAGGAVRGLGLLDVTTTPGGARAVGETVARLNPTIGDSLMTGFENHQGRTVIGPGAQPLAYTVDGVGNGDGTEGALYGRIVATYLHGPVLARNPLLADYLLTLATGAAMPPLHINDVDDLRRITLNQARRNLRGIRSLLRALTPAGWLNPGMPTGQAATRYGDHDVRFGEPGEDW